MKVKIIKCKNGAWWYASKINEIFEVTLNDTSDQYIYRPDFGWIGGIDIDDCIDIRELKLERILNEKLVN